MAAKGHIAFATSFAQCANDSRATANINGILNKLLMNFFEFLKNHDLLLKYNLSDINATTANTYHTNIAISGLSNISSDHVFRIFFNHLIIRYVANAHIIIHIYIGTHTWAASHLSSCFKIFLLIDNIRITAIIHHINGDITQLAAIFHICIQSTILLFVIRSHTD